MKKFYTVLLFSLLVMSAAIQTARLFVPLPKFDISTIDIYRIALAISTSAQAQRVKLELAHSASNLNAEKAKAISLGMPLTVQAPAVPPNQNAAPLYVEWYNMRRAASPSVPSYSDPTTLAYKYTPAEIAAVRQLDDGDPAANSTLMSAISRPYFFTTGYNRGSAPEQVVDRAVREASSEIETKANLLALQGDWPAAAATASNGFRLVAQAGQRHTLQGFVVASDVLWKAISEGDAILSHSAPDARICASFERPVTQLAHDISLQEDLRLGVGDMLDGDEAYRNATKFGSTDEEVPTVDSPQDRELFDQIYDVEESRELDDYIQGYRFSVEPRARRRADFAALTAHDKELGTLAGDPASDYFKDSCLYVGSLAPEDDLHAALIQVTLAAITVLSNKAKSGVFPEVLPQRFVDPFNGHPLRYRVAGRGFEIWSVGPSGTFDGSTTTRSHWAAFFLYPASPKVPLPPIKLQPESL